MYDMLLGGVTAVNLNQTTGALTTAWSRPDWKISDYIQSIGPAGSRVLISQYINQTNSSNPFVNADWNTYNYQESVLMVDQATGRTLAQLFYGSLTDCSTDYSKLKQPNTSPTALKVPFTP